MSDSPRVAMAMESIESVTSRAGQPCDGLRVKIYRVHGVYLGRRYGVYRKRRDV